MPALCQIRLRPGAPVPRAGEPLTIGLPLPRGACRQVSTLAVRTPAGTALPVQAAATATWDDGSVRWALLDLRADVGPDPSGTRLDVVSDGSALPDLPASVERRGDEVVVRTGPLVARVGPGADTPLRALSVDGRAVEGAAPLALSITGDTGETLPVRVTSVEVEAAGPVRVALLVTGEAGDRGSPPLRVRWRIEAFAGLAALRVRVTLHNPAAATHPGGIWELGDPGSLLLREVVVAIGPGPASDVAVSLERDHPLRPAALPFAVRQESSGGEHSNSPVHVSRSGAVPPARPGYQVTTGTQTADGRRATPVVVATLGGVPVAVAARRFWEVFPKACTAGDDGLRLALLPATQEPHELQGGERCSHTFVLAFGADPVTAVPLDWVRAPSVAVIDPAWWEAARVVAALAPVAAPDAPYEGLVQAALDGQDTFVSKREAIDEYGWRHYGELYADHENGPLGHDVRRVSHYNNQYDPIAGCIAQFARSGDPRWWELAADLAAHVADIDVYWTDRDRAAYNGGLFWHTSHYVDAGRSTHRSYPRAPGVSGGGPSNEHCYSTGLRLHYHLTGDPASREAVVGLAEWVLALDDGRRSRPPLPWLTTADTGGASATYEAGYHGPGRGAGNAIVALLDAWQLTGREAFLDKAHGLVRRCIHPADDVDARRLGDVEARWSYTVFLQVLGRYMATREAAAPGDPMWAYARASLLHYARWMASHEYFYLDRPGVLEFPNETWAAQEMRKAEVFDLAAQYATTMEERARFVERARWFQQRALSTLAATPMRTRTRPVVLLLSCGFAHAWHEAHRDTLPLLPAGPRHDFGAPAVFVPQRIVAERRAKALAAALVVIALGAAAALVSLLA